MPAQVLFSAVASVALAFARPSGTLLARPALLAPARAHVRAGPELDDELPRVRFVRSDAPPAWAIPAGDAVEERAAASTEPSRAPAVLNINQRLEARIDASVARLPRRPTKIDYTPVDLNGVQPWAALAGGVLYTAFAIGAWRATTIAAEWFTANPPPADVYIAQRISSVVRTVILGLTAMFAGISGVTSVGMYGLFIRVTYGVLTGELDPNMPEPAKSTEPAEPTGLDQALDALLPREWRR